MTVPGTEYTACPKVGQDVARAQLQSNMANNNLVVLHLWNKKLWSAAEHNACMSIADNMVCTIVTGLQAAQPIFDSSSSPPDLAAEGDTTVVLDSGEILKAHSSNLAAASDVFKPALACNQAEAIHFKQPLDTTPATSRVPLLGASKRLACCCTASTCSSVKAGPGA